MLEAETEIGPATPMESSSRHIVASENKAEDANSDVEELFRLHAVRLGRFLAQVVSSRPLAEDILQETFVTALGQRDSLDGVRNPEAWLFGIARNHALQAMRGRRRGWRALQRLARERVASQPDPAEAIAVRDHLEKHLKAEDRILLVLRYVHGFTSAELGEIVGRSSDAIRQQLSRARRTLIESLADDDAEANTAEDEPDAQ